VDLTLNFDTMSSDAPPRVACGWLLALLLAAAPSGLAQSPVAESLRALYRGDYQLAAGLAARHLKARPHDARARVVLARAVLAQGKFDEAFAELRRAVADDPADVDALYYLGMVSGVLSQIEHQQLFAMAPNSGRVHQLLAELALAQDKKTEAVAEYQAALAADPRSAELLIALAELHRQQSQLDEAVALYARAETVAAPSFETAYGLGACFAIKQEHQTAVGHFRRALAFEPDSAAARFALGNSLFSLGSLDAAVVELRSAATLEPKMHRAYFLLGRAYQRLGRKEEAAAAFKVVDQLSRDKAEPVRDATKPAGPRATAAPTPRPKKIP